MSAIARALLNVASGLIPRKSFEEVVEEQNTKNVWYPRVHGFPVKYTYGKVPGEPLVKHKRHPEGIPWPSCAPEQDQEIISRHIAICLRETGSHGGLCELCRKLNNPHRMDFLVRLYRDTRTLDVAGFNVGDAADKSVLNQSATSEYLRQLSDLGLVRRERCGRLVNYIPDMSRAPECIREIGAMLRARVLKDPDNMSFVPIFRIMMGSFRSRVVRLLAAGECGAVEAIGERFDKKAANVIQELDWAVRGGLQDLDSEDESGVYHYRTPADPIARRIVELS